MPETTTTTTTTPTTTTTTTTLLSEDIMWVGASNANVASETSSHWLHGLQYSTEEATILYSEDLGSPVNKTLFGINNHYMYVSTFDKLYKYSVDNFKGEKVVKQLLSVANDERMLMDAYQNNDNSVWAVDSYKGRVFKLNSDDLSIEETFEDFAAPFKIRYSTYHDVYFVADSYILWQIDGSGNVSIVYEINNYKLIDFDVSEKGVICMVLEGPSEDVIRILDKDKYKFLLNGGVTDVNLRFCTYCGEGRFYILGESSTDGVLYSSSHYVFDVTSNTLKRTNATQALSVTTTTTTLGTTTKAVQVTSPNGGEQLQLGAEYQITWISSKAVADAVKIDLYKGNELYVNVIESTENIGVYAWTVPDNLDEAQDYKVRITWASASSDPNDYDDSDAVFSIAESVTTTTTTTALPYTESSVGISYDNDSNQVIIMLQSGLFLVFTLSDSVVYGLIESGTTEVLSVSSNGFTIRGHDAQSKVRIFVGSELYQSDRWDSGIIDTELKSMYYGGGDNLVPGKKYYAHIQTFSELYGWGELQIREFVVPK